MNVTEAPPEASTDGLEQDSDDLVMTGWAAPASLAPDPLDAAQALIVAQRNVIRERNETVARLGYQVVTAESERDGALAAAHRYETASIRLSVENRALRERVEALQRANERRRRQAVRVLLARIGWTR